MTDYIPSPSSPSSSLSKWVLGGIAAGALLLPPGALLLWRVIGGEKKKKAAEKAEKIPLYGEARSHLEKFIFVEADYVGVVLGRHLRNIRKIEYETRTFINLISYGPNEMSHNIDAVRAYEYAASNWDNEEEAPSARDERNHFLRVHAQTQQQITLVELAIEALITDAKRKKNRDEMQIPTSAVGYVIGKGGDRIKKLSKQFRVRAVITQDGCDFETVVLEGTPEGIEGAKIRILELVDWSERMNGDGEELEENVHDQFKQMAELKKLLEEEEERW